MGPGMLRHQTRQRRKGKPEPSLGSIQLSELQQPAISDGLCSSSTASQLCGHSVQGAEEALATVQRIPESRPNWSSADAMAPLSRELSQSPQSGLCRHRSMCTEHAGSQACTPHWEPHYLPMCGVLVELSHQRSTPQPSLPAGQKHCASDSTRNSPEEQERHFNLSTEWPCSLVF